MICAVAVKNRRSPTPHEVIIAIKRNFGGLEGLDPVQEFGKFLPFILQERVLYEQLLSYLSHLYKLLKYVSLHVIKVNFSKFSKCN